MSVHPYAALLDAIGFYVERANGTDVLVNEIEGGLLVAFVTDTDQQVLTLDDAELTQLRAESAARPRLGIRLRGLLGRTDAVTSGPAGAGPLQPKDQTGLRARLRAVGRYLETRGAIAVTLQEQADGYVVEYTGQPLDDNLAPLIRLAERLDGHQLQAWTRQPQAGRGETP
jgi:hypothetical protein